MSLTSLLDAEDGSVRRWFGRTFPKVSVVRRAYDADRPGRHVQRPVSHARSRVRWDILGHAVDHRLRCAFTPMGSINPVKAGVLITAQSLPPTAGEAVLTTARQLFDRRAALLDAASPHRRGSPWLLADHDEDLLCRLCYVMSWFERVGRDGMVGSGSPLSAVTESTTLDALLAVVPSYAIDDMRVQVALAETELGRLRDRAPTDACISGPAFAGSGLVGGADADLVVDGLLLDFKATTRPESLRVKTIYQLLGYVLLDFDDEYSISSAGLYMSRIGWLVCWPLDDLLAMLGAREPLPELRRRFRAHLRDHW